MLKFGLFSRSADGWMTARGTVSTSRGLAIRFTSYDEADLYRDQRFASGDIATPYVWLIVVWKE